MYSEASTYVLPLFSFFGSHRFVFPSKGEDSPDYMSFPWSIYTKVY